MCGIAGAVSARSDGAVDLEIIKTACREMRHRGPDDEGYFRDEIAALGMVRLAIIDLETGNQPIENEDRSAVLVHNGEIYNYRPLRKTLENHGHRFRTESDSETILHAYEQFGKDFIHHLNGMFAFAIWDSGNRSMHLARDRLGIKPLYYWHDGRSLYFASELKALLRMIPGSPKLDASAIDLFLSLEYIPAPHTILKGIKKLPAGHRLIFRNGEVVLEEYWDVPENVDSISRKESLDELHSLLEDSVRMRMISDVPLGVFLSGGIDSTTILSFMASISQDPIRAFSIGFEDPTYNELPDARAAAVQFSATHKTQVLKPDIAELAAYLLQRMDEPLGDFSIFPTYQVSRFARQEVKVVLSGDGGDEVFAGYDPYLAESLDRYYRFLPRFVRTSWNPKFVSRIRPGTSKKGFTNKVKRFVQGAALSPELEHVRWMTFLNEWEKTKLYSPELRRMIKGCPVTDTFLPIFCKAAGRDRISRMQYVDLKTYLAENILTKVDRMSMAASLETRLPMLDHRIVEFGLNLPPEVKISGFQTKKILRELMKNTLPETTLKKPKQGFSIPIKDWLCGALKPMMMDTLSEARIRERGLFQSEGVKKLISDHIQRRANHSHIIWSLIVLESWCQEVFDG
jgi:asparagine synthase (glutamine-hydrolysing)